MKKIFLFVLLLVSLTGSSQQAYYDDVDLSLTGTALRDALATKVVSTHTGALSYSDIWSACKATDLDTNNSENVLLIYGWEKQGDDDVTNDYSRDKDENGGGNGDWNREHTFAVSLANPALKSSGTKGPPYSDGHNLRAVDVRRNSLRGNRKFASGSGVSGTVGANWYPGDEWKGDVARIVMYMYLRYGSQCYPKLVATGTANTLDANMVDLLLEWNSQDPVSAYEDARNAYHGNTSNPHAQGNRNPFIDNPYLATIIWGGTPAEGRWDRFSDDDNSNINSSEEEEESNIDRKPSGGDASPSIDDSNTGFSGRSGVLDVLIAFSTNRKRVRHLWQL